MGLILYHYVHCPFCIRVRMAIGFLNLKYKSVVLRYDDEETPKKLTGRKMLPALTFGENTINESLDIIGLIDKDKRLNVDFYKSSESFIEFETMLNDIASPIHPITMPYWVYTPEFDDKSRSYFKHKKEAKRGPFSELIKNQHTFLAKLEPMLQKIENELGPFYQSVELRLQDILIASHLWGLYIVPEFQFSEKMHKYLQGIKKITHFEYQQDLLELM